MKKALTVAALSAALVFGTAAGCEKPEGTTYYPVDLSDCDADDRSPKWEVADCGPSPLPMQTAYQPKPSSAKKPTPAPKPKNTRR